MMRFHYNRRSFVIIGVTLFSCIYLFDIKINQNGKDNITSSLEIYSLFERLLDKNVDLVQIQNSWNKIFGIWREILLKFAHDGCYLCHETKYFECVQSININDYLYSINNSYFPNNESRRPDGMGLYYGFDLKSLYSLDNLFSLNNVPVCDYFHMIQLLIYVQTALHEKGIPYFITKGTFMGSLRHHNIIPWDTDIDIFIPNSSVSILKTAFRQLIIQTNEENIQNETNDEEIYTDPLCKKDLVVYQFRNIYKVTSYKIFSIRSPRVNQTHYHWPKVDIFPYDESPTQMFAFPTHRHNIGTMKYLLKSDVQPTHLRPLGPLFLPSPRNPIPSLNAMIQLDKSNIFRICQENTFLHRENQVSTKVRRVPCLSLTKYYSFVKSYWNMTNSVCTEMVLFKETDKTISLFMYRCDEQLQRTWDFK